MNTALAILAHALRMLVFEPATTLRVLMPALIMVGGCSLAIAVFAPGTIELLQSGSQEPPTVVPDVGLFVAFGALGLMGYALMAILWHRHVLLNGAERPQELRPDRRIFLGYIWRAIVVGCFQFAAAVPITLVMGILGAVLVRGGPASLTATLIGLLGSIVFIWIALRLSVALPAAALGLTLAVRDSWNITKPLASELWGVAVLLTGLNMGIYAITALLLPDTGTIVVVAQTLVFVIEGLIFVSVLTTLYGHLIEGRSLGQ